MFRVPLNGVITIKEKRGKTSDDHPFKCNVEITPAYSCVGGDQHALPDPSIFPQEAAHVFPHKECEDGSKDPTRTPFLESMYSQI